MIFSVSDDCRPARDTDGDVSTPHSGLHGCGLHHIASNMA